MSCSPRNLRSTAKGVARRCRAPAGPVHDDDQDLREDEAQQRRQDDAQCRDAQPAEDDRAKPRLGYGGPGQAANQRMAAAGRNTQVPGDDVPHDRAGQRTEDDAAVHHASAHDARAHRLRNVQPEYRERDEIEERRPNDSGLRPEHAGRHHRRDRVRGVVQSVEKIEHQRHGDQPDQDGKSKRGSVHVVVARSTMPGDHTCLAVMDWMALATSSHLSTTFSISS